jgi:LuxR family maltose regulon positive regulatory protein
LGRAVKLAEPGGFVRLFVDLGPQMVSLLENAAASGLESRLVRRILAAAGDSTSDTDAAPPALAEPISERELDVLRLILSGLSNQEIADKLFVSQNTIKTHIRHLYRKLNASNRAQAIARAHQLELL